jgi:nicotinamidase/pyrazinamidase
MTKDALILIDIQNDFLPGGSLAVPEGDAVVPVANMAMVHFNLTVATQDSHPPNHKSFASQFGMKPGESIELNGIDQLLWPDHCIFGTHGWQMADGIIKENIDFFYPKGIERNVDSYSAFYNNGVMRFLTETMDIAITNREGKYTPYVAKYSTGLTDFLVKEKVERVFIMGLATDYCVKHSALDAIKDGFETYLISDGCRAVNPEESDSAIEEMRESGVNVIDSLELMNMIP